MEAGLYIEIVAGAAAAAPAIFFIRRFGPDRQLGLFALSLVIAAAVYAVFSAAGAAAGSASAGWIALEFAGIPLFGIFAYLGSRKWPWVVSLGWFLHLFWDFALHGGPETSFVPGFYPAFCVGFDLVFAAYILYHFRLARRT